MTIDKVYDYINYLIRKDRRGSTLSVGEFNRLAEAKTHWMYDRLLKQYEATRQITDSIKRFKTVMGEGTPSLQVTSGVATLPADYGMFSGAYFRDVVGGETFIRKIDEVTSEEYIERMSSYLKRPTRERPIIELRNGIARVEPNADIDYIVFSYLREPNIPYLDSWIDGNGNIKLYRDENATTSLYTVGGSSTIVWNTNVLENVGNAIDVLPGAIIRGGNGVFNPGGLYYPCDVLSITGNNIILNQTETVPGAYINISGVTYINTIGDNVNFDFEDGEINLIVSAILSDIGMSMKDNIAIQYGELTKQQ